jgi:uncharacterized DUF497 family protein
MLITFDPAKDESNLAKHGVSLAESAMVEWETLYAFEDDRKEYGEIRVRGYAYIGLRLYCVVYVDRDNARRIISLRKANQREVQHYAEA